MDYLASVILRLVQHQAQLQTASGMEPMLVLLSALALLAGQGSASSSQVVLLFHSLFFGGDSIDKAFFERNEEDLKKKS